MDIQFNTSRNNVNFGAKLKIKNRSCWNKIIELHNNSEYPHNIRILHEALDDFKKFEPKKIYEVSHQRYIPSDAYDVSAHDQFIFTCDGEKVLDIKGENFIEALSRLMGKKTHHYLLNNKKISSFDVFEK